MRLLSIGVPLILGLCLVALFVVLLVRFREPVQVAAPVQPPAAPAEPKVAAPAPAPTVPSLEETQERPVAPPPGPGVQRWAFDHLPEGWDPVIAEQLAKYFELLALRNPTDAAARAAMYEARDQIEQYLASLGPDAIPTLSAILGAEPYFGNRRFLLYALGNLGPRSEEATFALIDFYRRNRFAIEARSEMSHLIEAMGSLKNETSYQLINEQIDDRATPDALKDKFIVALGKHPRAGQSMNKFVEYMDYEESAQIRNHSAQALGILKNPQSLDSLITRFPRETFLPVRQTILGSIGKIGDPSALPFLEGEARNSGEDGIRLSASRAIWLIGTPKALKLLRATRQVERSEMIRENIDKWLQETATANQR